MLGIYEHHDGENWEHIDLEACRDCFIYAVHGEVSEPLDPECWGAEDEWSADQVDEKWSDYHLHCPASPQLQDGYFSWEKCEVCNRRLGGDRHHLIAMRQLPPGEALLRLSKQQGEEDESELESN